MKSTYIECSSAAIARSLAVSSNASSSAAAATGSAKDAFVQLLYCVLADDKHLTSLLQLITLVSSGQLSNRMLATAAGCVDLIGRRVQF